MSGHEMEPAERAELEPAGPAPMLAGTFALYATPDGGFALTTDIPGRGVETKVIPGKVVRLLTHGAGKHMFGRIFSGEG